MKYHRLAELFPIMPDEELAELAQNIKEVGLIQPILAYDNQILDGRNRYLACQKVGVTPHFKEYEGDGDLAALVEACNLKRRHLTPEKKAILGAELANLKRGRQQMGEKGLFREPSGKQGITQTEAAKMVGSSSREVKRAKRVLTQGTPEEIEAVKAGKISLKAAEKAISERTNPVSNKSLPDPTPSPLSEPEVKPEKEPKFGRRKKIKIPPLRASDAMQFATMAQLQLEQILKEDLMKEAALETVVNYINTVTREFFGYEYIKQEIASTQLHDRLQQF
jgi:ParB-like chromosome segregation protein Spo0J